MQRFSVFYCQDGMKQIIAVLILLCSLLISLAGCKKNLSRDDKSLIGTWELRQRQGGMMPSITYPAGNGNRLSFSTATYQKFEDNAFVSSGNYSVMSDNSVEQSVGLIVPQGQYQQRIDFQNAPKAFFQVNGNELKLLSGYFPTDGGTSAVYERVSE